MPAAPHIRDLDLNPRDWHEVPTGATIPAGTRYICTLTNGDWFAADGITDCTPDDRFLSSRYFTAEPIPEPREAEIAAEAERLYLICYPEFDDAWEFLDHRVRVLFRRLAVDSLDRQKKEN